MDIFCNNWVNGVLGKVIVGVLVGVGVFICRGFLVSVWGIVRKCMVSGVRKVRSYLHLRRHLCQHFKLIRKTRQLVREVRELRIRLEALEGEVAEIDRQGTEADDEFCASVLDLLEVMMSFKRGASLSQLQKILGWEPNYLEGVMLFLNQAGLATCGKLPGMEFNGSITRSGKIFLMQVGRLRR